MSSDIEKAREGVAIVGELIKIAGDDPNVRQAAGNLGQAALTLSKTINNALLPLAAVNFAFDKAKKYFAEKFEEDISEKVKEIPDGCLIEPKPSIAGPALQGLAFCHEEAPLKDMFLSLLAAAMDVNKSTIAHPAFVEIIKQLTAEEASLLIVFFKMGRAHPIALLKLLETDDGSYDEIKRHVMNVRDGQSGRPIEVKSLSAMVDNWIRLGLVDVEYGTYLIGENNYFWLNERPEYTRFERDKINQEKKLEWERGVFQVTDFGLQFAAAVDIKIDDA